MTKLTEKVYVRSHEPIFLGLIWRRRHALCFSYARHDTYHRLTYPDGLH